MTSSDVASIGDEVLRLQRRERLVREANIMKSAVDGESGHIVFEGKGMRHVSCVEDEVECESPSFGPIFVRGGDEFFGA